MMRMALTLGLAVAAGPALAASEYGFFSLRNTDFIVLIGFLIFLGILVYFKVPPMLAKMLDDRAAGIQRDLDEARALREEAQTLLASYERKAREVNDQADRIVARAKEEAAEAAEQSKEDIRKSVERRLNAAEEQIASARAAAVKDVRDQAVNVAISAARDVVASQMSADDRNKLTDEAIGTIEAKLH
ncbi:F0F1 ATP synthase subunit B [Aestuariibius sp. 2305UL40-4]|uniref:F0F1 ATP synthase subunit B n=1 Tax=Aestuariibius violaceus TaxID=3234132 RepID=UPI00345E2F6D